MIDVQAAARSGLRGKGKKSKNRTKDPRERRRNERSPRWRASKRRGATGWEGIIQ